MKMSVSKEVAFDYSDMEADTAGKLTRIAEVVNTSRARVASELLKIAAEIAKAHSVLKNVGRDGQFSAWVRSECHCSHSQAYRLIDIFNAFSGCEEIAQFEDSAVRRLADPSTPQEVLDGAKKIAKRGNFVSLDTVKEMVATWKAQNVDEDDEPEIIEQDEEEDEYDEADEEDQRGDTGLKDAGIAGGDYAGQPRVDRVPRSDGNGSTGGSQERTRVAPYDLTSWSKLILKLIDAVDAAATELNVGSSERESAHEILRDLDARVCGWNE